MTTPAEDPTELPIHNAEASLSFTDVNDVSAASFKKEADDPIVLQDLSTTMSDIDISHAESSLPSPQEMQTTVHGQRKSSGRRKYWIGAGLILLIVGVVVGVVLATNGSSDDSSSSSSRAPPNTSSTEEDEVATTEGPPTGTTVTTVEDVIDYLVSQGVSDEADLRTTGTPQNLAAVWMAIGDGAQLPVPITALYNAPDVLDREAYLYVCRYVLALDYFAWNGPNWHFQTFFLSDEDICDWNDASYGVQSGAIGYENGGVFCDEDTGLPIAIDLELNNVIGTIPTENGLLRSLVFFDLDYNFLTGTFPTELCELENLRYLLLKNSTLEGQLPSCVSSFTDLWALDLLYNSMTGELPTGLCDMTEMQFLGLDKNFFEGSIPECITGLTGLQFLSLSDNLLTGDLPDLSPLQENLVQLYLDGNFFTGTPLGTLGQLTNLTFLYLDGNQFKGDISTFATEMQSLVVLDLSTNFFTSSVGIPAHLFELPDLQVLDLSSNMIDGEFPEGMFVPDGSQLRFFTIHQNEVSGPIPLGLLSLNRLLHLDLANNALTGPIPDAIFALPALSTLFLSENPGLDPGPLPNTLSFARQLREISMKNTNLIGPLPELLGFNLLFILDLDNNDLTGMIPSNYGILPNLRHLILNRNPSLIGDVPQFTETGNLGTVLLDGTALTGDLSSICSLPGFTGKVDLATDIIAVADCAGENPEIECSCCHCCAREDGGCSDPIVASLDWTWESGFRRTEREFAVDTGVLEPPEEHPAGAGGN